MEEYQTQIKQCVKKADVEVIKEALKNEKKSETSVSLQIWKDRNILP